jgi:hypothetical protein
MAPTRRVLAMLTAALIAGCGTSGPTSDPTAGPTTSSPAATAVPSPSLESARPAVEIYAEIRTAVEAIRGLSPTAAVEPVLIDEAQLRTNLAAEFDAAQTPQQLADTEAMLEALGLLPKGASLRQLTLDFQAGQVAGYYSPEKDQLFVVQRTEGVGAVAESTYAHEFTHQLQDQHVDLEALGTAVADQSDRSLARLALVEGDATSVQATWMTANLNAKEMGEILAASLDPAAVAALQNAPAFLRDTSIFPYQEGFAFVSGLLAKGQYAAVDAAFADPPDSTEQILHPEKYATREDPIKVAIRGDLAKAVGPGWSLATQDTLGELLLRIWLAEGGVPPGTARAAAAGWGGDRAVLLRGPGGATCVGLATVWDSAAEATEFLAAVHSITVSAAGPGAIVQLGTRPTAVYLGFGPCDSAVAEALAR